MADNRKIFLNLKSDSYTDIHPDPLVFELTANLSSGPEAEQNVENEQQATSEQTMSDALFIRFKSSKEVPQEVKDYITTTLGTFDLVENGNEKTFSFELKIKDIDTESIKTAYKAHFEKQSEKFDFKVRYQKSQSLSELAEQLKVKYRAPLLFHLLEKSALKVEIGSYDVLAKSLFSYLKSQKVPVLNFFLNFFDNFQDINGEIVMNSLADMDENLMEEMGWDQKENFKEVFGSLDNPINNYIFDEEIEGQELIITGKILNIVNYEFKSKVGGLKEFLKKVENLD